LNEGKDEKKRNEYNTLTTKMGGEADHLAGGEQVRFRQFCVIYHSPHLGIIDNRSVKLSVFPQLWIRIGFNADPDPDFFINSDPDLGQTLPSLKGIFLMKIILYVGNGS
jgi:hypothetical protein